MKLTEKKAINILKKVRSYELEQMVEEYPEDEREGRTDLEIIKNELDWLLYGMNEDGYLKHEALMEARQIVNDTRGGRMPLNPYTLKPKYKDYEIRQAKDDINEYNRLKRLQKRLEGGD